MYFPSNPMIPTSFVLVWASLAFTQLSGLTSDLRAKACLLCIYCLCGRLHASVAVTARNKLIGIASISA
jgi:hypothetical protein